MATTDTRAQAAARDRRYKTFVVLEELVQELSRLHHVFENDSAEELLTDLFGEGKYDQVAADFSARIPAVLAKTKRAWLAYAVADAKAVTLGCQTVDEVPDHDPMHGLGGAQGRLDCTIDGGNAYIAQCSGASCSCRPKSSLKVAA